jgi:hypothetical protein
MPSSDALMAGTFDSFDAPWMAPSAALAVPSPRLEYPARRPNSGASRKRITRTLAQPKIIPTAGPQAQVFPLRLAACAAVVLLAGGIPGRPAISDGEARREEAPACHRNDPRPEPVRGTQAPRPHRKEMNCRSCQHDQIL